MSNKEKFWYFYREARCAYYEYKREDDITLKMLILDIIYCIPYVLSL